MIGTVFDIQRCTSEDGPGIRTTVFMKGCPLRCLWCHNPESQKETPELMFFRTRCQSCGACVAACNNQVHSLVPERVVDFLSCRLEENCVVSCFSDALRALGRHLTVNDVLNVVEKDVPYYTASQGGVTVSGGEPASQPGFVAELCWRLQEKGIHTALDTSGYAPWSAFEQILPFINLTLFDLKHIDNVKHQRLTGASNEQILWNLRRMKQNGMPLVVRFPMIPGCNDSLENVQDTALLLGELGINTVEVVPYHTLGIAKYEQLGRKYGLMDNMLSKEDIESKVTIFQEHGIDASINYIFSKVRID